jgi:DNA-binding NarL/FixJ family response regulator
LVVNWQRSDDDVRRVCLARVCRSASRDDATWLELPCAGGNALIRVVIADDHHLVRHGIRALLEKEKDIQVVGEAADGHEAIELVGRLLPDVVVMDIAMPGLNGIEAVKRIRALDVKTRIVVLSMYSDESLVREALKHGVNGYLTKRAVTEELLSAVHAAIRGETYLSPEVSDYVLEPPPQSKVASPETPKYDLLTSREREVLQLIAEGNTNSLIAVKLGISEKTVEKHRANLMSKLKVHDVASLVRIAIRQKLIFLDSN